MPATTASATLLEPVLQLAQHYRLDPLQVLDQAALSQADFTKPGARFPTSNYKHVLRLLAEATDNPSIALNLGESTQPRMLGATGFLMSTAATLGKAYQTLIYYLPLLFEGAVLSMEQTAEGTLLTLETSEPDRQTTEYLLACLINWPRWLTGQQIPVRFVHLAFPEPGSLQPYQRFFAAEVQFDAPANQLLLASEYLTLSCVDANAEMHQLHREFADTLLSKTSQPRALIAQIRNLIRQQLAEGQGAVRRESITAAIGLSLRTLQRKLGLLDTSFQDVYDQTRREACLQLIQRDQLSLGEIAFQLGFSNQSAFQKAFKRWMGVAPSQYRRQINPVAAAELAPQQQPRSDWLDQDNRVELITQRIGRLSSFSLELLTWAAVLGPQFDLVELGRVTDNPVARLAIHLWSSEQAGLINAESRSSNEPSRYDFSHAEIRTVLYQRLSAPDKARRHHRCGITLLDALPESPTLQQLKPVLLHLEFGQQRCDPIQQRQLQQLNISAADLARQQHDYTRANHYLSQACRLLTADQSALKIRLLVQQAKLHLLAGQTEQAASCLQPLSAEPLESRDAVQIALVSAEIQQCNGQQALALAQLLNSLATVDKPLPEQAEQQLSLLLSQLASIRQPCKTATALQQLTRPDTLLRLQLLEQISLLARQLSNPLLAACAIGRMTEISLQHGRSRYTPFTFVSYAWVASWFCADYRLAQTFSARGMQLTLPDDSRAPAQHNRAHSDAAVDTAALLLQSSQVQHWFAPLQSARDQLQRVETESGRQGQWLIQGECRLLSHQLALLGATPLTEQLLLCRQHIEQMTAQGQHHQAERLHDSTLRLIEQLRGEQPQPDRSRYQHGWQAVSTLIGALLMNQQQLWPDLYQWEAPLENELPGYFGVTEALFCTAMMRLIQTQQQAVVGRRRQLEIEQIESRFELWAQHCPVNFNSQLQLLQAEKSRLLEQNPAHHFESAISAAEQQHSLVHQALSYERYGDYLQAQGQHHVARFCLTQASSLYQRWGASEKVKQLGQQQPLLAK